MSAKRIIVLTLTYDIMKDEDHAICLVQAALVGALVTAQTEFPKAQLTSVQVDAHTAMSSALSSILMNEAQRGGSDIEVSYTRCQRNVKIYSEITCESSMKDFAAINKNNKALIISGGLGALGLVTARILIELGANNIALISRTGKLSVNAQELNELLSWLQSSSGANVQVMRCDVSKEDEVVSMLDTVRETMGPIGGIVHAAGVIRDGLIRGGSAAAGSAEVWSSKAASAWLLHKHTLQDNLSTFVTFSSITSGPTARATGSDYPKRLCLLL